MWKYPRPPYKGIVVTELSRELRLHTIKQALKAFQNDDGFPVPWEVIPRIIGPFLALVPLNPFATHKYVLLDGDTVDSYPLAWVLLLEYRD